MKNYSSIILTIIAAIYPFFVNMSPYLLLSLLLFISRLISNNNYQEIL